MKPLDELAQGPSSILDRELVKTLFGPIADIANHHELFYSALLSRTLDWHIQQKIGDIFMSSVSDICTSSHELVEVEFLIAKPKLTECGWG